MEGVEDHPQNYTRFHLIDREGTGDGAGSQSAGIEAGGIEVANKMSVAFAVEHRPGTLVGALEGLAAVGADLTKIESRPVPGRPWEYVFYVDIRFAGGGVADAALDSLRRRCGMVKELGRYMAADRG